MLVEQIAYREHYLIGRRKVLEVAECGKMSLTVHCVIGVLAIAVRKQSCLAYLLVKSPFLAEEVWKVQDIYTQLECMLGITHI